MNAKHAVQRLIGLALAAGLLLLVVFQAWSHRATLAIVVVGALIGGWVLRTRTRWGVVIGGLLGLVIGVPLSHYGEEPSRPSGGAVDHLTVSDALIGAVVMIAAAIAALYFFVRHLRQDDEEAK